VDIPEMSREEFEKKGTRVLAFFYGALNEIGDLFNARNLAPDVMEILMEAGLSETLSTITGLKAVYIKGFSPRRQLKPTH